MKCAAAILFALAALAGALPALAVKPVTLATNRMAERATVFSASHRYAISGCPAARGLEIGAWAEDVEQRLARFLGTPIPAGDPMPIVIRLVEDAESARGRVVRSQELDTGMLSQRLDLINPATADQEDLLEGLCWLLINRAVVSRQPAAARGRDTSRAPDWLAVGAAQNLFPESRQRNEKTVIELWKKNRAHRLEEILGWAFLPAGRWDEKAEAGVFVQFMLHPSVAATRTAALLARIESGEPLTAEFVAQRVLNAPSVADVEKARDIWIAQQTDDIASSSLEFSVDRVAELVRLLDMRPTDYGLPESDRMPPLVDLKDLIRHKGESWAPKLAERVGMKAKLLAVGQPPEFQRVVASYVGFLDAVAGRKKGFTGGLFGGSASTSSLQKLLDQAEATFIAFQQAQKQREKFIEDAIPKEGDSSPDPAIRDYLDRLELLSTPVP